MGLEFKKAEKRWLRLSLYEYGRYVMIDSGNVGWVKFNRQNAPRLESNTVNSS